MQSLCAHADSELFRRRLLTKPTQIIVAGHLIKVAFIDADGTIRPAMRPGVPVNFPHEVELLPYVVNEIKALNEAGFFVAIISNQAGVPKFASLKQVDAALYHTVERLAQRGAYVDYYDFAENMDDDRKPGVGMGLRLENYLKEKFNIAGIDRKNSLMVGDGAWLKAHKDRPAEMRPDGRPGFNHSNADRLFAENFGVSFIEAADFFKWRLLHNIDAIDFIYDLKEFLKKNPEVARSEKCEYLLRDEQLVSKILPPRF